jgi:methionyl-tRNA formyltransferase
MILKITCTKNVKDAVYFASPEDLELHLNQNPVDTLLFIVWHWKVKDHILQKYKCYGMHTGPLLEKKGRGPAPIKNLKALGVKWATLCVFSMTKEIDSGPIHAAIPISLEGSEVDVYDRITVNLPRIIGYLEQDLSSIPALFTRDSVRS